MPVSVHWLTQTSVQLLLPRHHAATRDRLPVWFEDALWGRSAPLLYVYQDVAVWVWVG